MLRGMLALLLALPLAAGCAAPPSPLPGRAAAPACEPGRPGCPPSAAAASSAPESPAAAAHGGPIETGGGGGY
jgi:hypothetical protein